MQEHDATEQARTETSPEAAPRDIKRWLASGEAVLVDVREPDEHARERIVGSMLMPLTKFDPKAALGRIEPGKTIVIHCRGGVRGAEAARKISECAGPGIKVFSMTGGIERWKADGLEVEVNSAVCRVSIMRQVQMVVGVGALAGSALAWFVHPGFVVIPAILGAGLTFAGATGFCGLALLLGVMPWNKAGASAGTGDIGTTCSR